MDKGEIREAATIIKRHADGKCNCRADHTCKNKVKRLANRILHELDHKPCDGSCRDRGHPCEKHWDLSSSTGDPDDGVL